MNTDLTIIEGVHTAADLAAWQAAEPWPSNPVYVRLDNTSAEFIVDPNTAIFAFGGPVTKIELSAVLYDLGNWDQELIS